MTTAAPPLSRTTSVSSSRAEVSVTAPLIPSLGFTAGAVRLKKRSAVTIIGVAVVVLTAMPIGSRLWAQEPAGKTGESEADAKSKDSAKRASSETGAADPKRPERPKYEFRRDHDPNGTGKFYMGREIALVMGHQGADWLERPEREEEEEPTRMVDSLKLKEGDVVADIGCGTGFIAWKLAKKVGPKGKVYGVDIQPEMLARLRLGMKRRGIDNVEPVMGTIQDPKLPANSVDLIIMVDVYHEFSHPWEMTDAMVKALKPGGRLVFVEYRREDESVPIKLVHKMSQEQVKKEMSVHPLDHDETIGILPWQHIIIFRKRKDPSATPTSPVSVQPPTPSRNPAP